MLTKEFHTMSQGLISRLTTIGLVFFSALCISVTGGCSTSCNKDIPVVLMPCKIPDDLPNNAMGKLGIRDIKINNTHRIIVPTDKIFEPRSARIMDSAYPGLSQLADYLQKFTPVPMAVSGYTDSLGSYPEDQTLSDKQARSLISYFWTHGIAHECLMPMGIGKDENYTIASNRGVDGSVANRRIEITFKKPSFYEPRP